MGVFLDISIKRNRICRNAADFFERYGAISYAHYNRLSESVTITGLVSASFRESYQYAQGKWEFDAYDSPLGIVKMIRIVRRKKPEWIFVHGFVRPGYLWLLRRFAGRRAVWMIQHHAERPKISPVGMALQRIAFRRLDCYFFAARDLAHDFVTRGIIGDPSKIHEMMEGSSLFEPIDRMFARKQLGITAKTIFLWVGRLNANKDPMTVLRAFTGYANSGSEGVLYILFSEDDLLKDVARFLSDVKMEARIILVGKRPHPELQFWYSAADYFISASHYEGSGIALCEAMACGCIPIVTRIPSFCMMTENGRFGYQFTPGEDIELQMILNRVEADLTISRTTVRQQFINRLSFEAIGNCIIGCANTRD